MGYERRIRFCYAAVWPLFLLPGQGVYIYISYGIINTYYRDMTGKLSAGMGGLIFATKESWEKIPLNRNYSTIVANGCKSCGAIYDIRMENPEKVK